MIHRTDLARYHHIARMVEDDGAEMYHHIRTMYGPDIAGLAVVMWLRQRLNKEPDAWPPPDELVGLVGEALKTKGLLDERL